LGAVAFSNDYNDLDNLPSIPTLTSELTNDSGFITSADIPPIPTLTSELTNDSGFITSADIPPIPTLTSELTNDSGFITIGEVPPQVNSDWNATSGVKEILNKPTIPAAQVNSDWNASSGLAQILNKPTIPAAQIQSDWNQANTSALDFIKNKPTINAGTVTSVGTTGLISGGPITGSGTITTAMDTNKLVGRYTAGTGIMEQITIGSGLTLTGAGVLNNSATPTATGYYGAFQDTTSQTAASINTAYPVKFNTTDLSNGVTVVNDGSSNPTRVTLENTGIYNIQFSLQLEKTGGSGNMIADIWLRKNGVDIPSTTGKVVLTGSANASPVIAAWNYVLDLVAGDYVQLMWATSNTNVEIVAASATAPHPAIPSSILTVTQQAGIMGGTGITAINSLTGAAQTMGVGTTGTDFAISSAGTAHTFNLPTASASNRGALSSADWSTFNSKVGTARSISTSSPLSGGGDLSANRTLSIADAAADGSTKGAAAFTAADFNATSGIISIDYTNAQKATSGQAGFLTAADWSTFNGKQNSIGLTTVGTNFATLANPSAITYPRINADNSVTALTLAQLKTDLSISSNITVVLGSNVTNVGTSLEDITAFSFAVAANKTYRFRTTILYARTSGTGYFAINGPTFATNGMSYRFTQPGTATTNQFNNQIAYNGGTSATLASGGIVIGEGIIKTTASGTVIMRMQCSAGASLTIQSGSFIEYSEIA
jgi:hypothetical protein